MAFAIFTSSLVCPHLNANASQLEMECDELDSMIFHNEDSKELGLIIIIINLSHYLESIAARDHLTLDERVYRVR